MRKSVHYTVTATNTNSQGLSSQQGYQTRHTDTDNVTQCPASSRQEGLMCAFGSGASPELRECQSRLPRTRLLYLWGGGRGEGRGGEGRGEWEGGEGKRERGVGGEGDKVIKWQQILSGIAHQVLSLS